MNTNIHNFYSYSNTVHAGAQPQISDLEDLKKHDFEVVFNISPKSARNYLEQEAEVVEQLGMHYVHFPIDCGNLQDFHFPIFRDILKNFSNKKVFVHCGGNIKTSNLLYMFQVLEQKIDKDEAFITLLKIQNPEPKWFTYFAKFNM